MTDDVNGKERNDALIEDNKHMKELLKPYKFKGDHIKKIKMYGNIVEKTKRYLADVEIRHLFDDIRNLSRLITIMEDLPEIVEPESKDSISDNISDIIENIKTRYTTYKDDINKFNTEYTNIKLLIL